MAHGHDHGALGHHHVHVGEGADRRRLVLALGLLGGFMLVEVVVGVFAWAIRQTAYRYR